MKSFIIHLLILIICFAQDNSFTKVEALYKLPVAYQIFLKSDIDSALTQLSTATSKVDLYNIAYINFLNKNYSKANEAIRKSMLIKNNNDALDSWINYLYAQILIKKKELIKAQRFLKKAIDLDSDISIFHFADFEKMKIPNLVIFFFFSIVDICRTGR